MAKSILKKIQQIITQPQHSILSATAVMMILVVAAKALGFVIKAVSAHQFGASREYDMFVVANTLPEMLLMIIMSGAITAALIPTLTKCKTREGEDRMWAVLSSILNWGVLTFTIFALIGAIFAYDLLQFTITRIAKPDEPFTQAQIYEMVSMMRLLFIPQILLGISSFISSALHIFRRFLITQIAPVLYNLGLLFGVLFLVPLFNRSVWGLVWGMLIGATLHLLIQIPLLGHLKMPYQLVFDLKDSYIKESFRLGFPRTLGLAAYQLAKGIDQMIIAVGLIGGSLSAYSFAVSLVTIPFSLFGNTFSQAAFPTLSKEYSEGNLDKFKEAFTQTFNQILFFTIPVTGILLVLRVPLVRLALGLGRGGNFTWEDTLMTAWIIFFLSIGLIPETLSFYLDRVFYSMHNTWKPVIVGLIVVILGIATGFVFTYYFAHFNDFAVKELTLDPDLFFPKYDGIEGYISQRPNGAAAVGGLAASSSLTYFVAISLLLYWLNKDTKVLHFKTFWFPILKKLFAGLLMLITMYFLFRIWDGVLDTSRTIYVFILTSSTIVSGLAVYLWIAYILKCKEIGLIGKVYARIIALVPRARQ